MAHLEFKNVSFKYKTDDYILLNNISFSIEKDEFVTVIGASGCGKSTVFRLINGLEDNYDGEILIDGEKLVKAKSYAAFMPQRDLLLPWRSILKNVALPLENVKMPKSERMKRAAEAVGRVGLSGYEKKYPAELSGGMRQRASFARTMLAGGQLMLLDEPFSALDSLTRTAMQDWLLSIVKTIGKTVMMVTHDIDEAMLLGDKILLMAGKPVTEIRMIDVSHIRCRNDLYKPEAVELKNQLVSQFTIDIFDGRNYD